MDKIQELVCNLQKENIKIEDLSNEQFNDVIAELVATKCLDCSGNYIHIKDRRRRAIDIIIKEKFKYTPQFNNRVHFINNYNNIEELTLDNVEKAFCITIKEKPYSLTFLNSGIIRREVFEFGESSLKNTNFDVRDIKELIGLKEESPRKVDINSGEILSIYVSEWDLVKKSTFYENTIASSFANVKEVFIDDECDYVIYIWIEYIGKKEILDKAILTFEDLRDHRIEINLEKTEMKGRLQKLFSKIPIKKNNQNEMVLPILTIKTQNGCDSIKIENFPILSYSSISPELPDLREAFTYKKSELILKNKSENIITVHGEGGIGKTYFCSAVCKLLNKKNKYECTVIPISSETTASIFLQLLWPIIFPKNSNIYINSSKEGTKEFIYNYLISLITSEIDSDDPKSIVNSILTARLTDESLEAIISLVSSSFSQNPQGRAILFTNCQNFSAPCLRAFRQFIASIEQHGWGNLKIFCEYRDTSDEFSEEWQDCISWLLKDYRHVLTDIKIEPLGFVELNHGLSTIFNFGNINFLAKIIFNKTGGNPLFLSHLVKELFRKNIIYQSELKELSNLYEIKSIKEVENHIEELPSTIKELLLHRLKYINIDFDKKNIFSQTSIFLGLAALMGLIIKEPLLKDLFPLDNKQFNILKNELVKENILTVKLDDTLMFSHDMMRAAAKSFVHGDKNLINLVERVIAIPDDGTVELLVNKARCAAFVKKNKEVCRLYNMGLERAKRINDFNLQHVCANEYLEFIDSQEIIEGQMQILYHDLLDSACWAEEHVGSCLKTFKMAKKGLERLNETFYNDDTFWNNASLRDYRPRYFHRLIGLSIDLLKPKYFFDYASIALREVSDPTRLGHILNRIILQCFLSGLFEEGLEIARLALIVAPLSKNQSVYAILCTDIAMLYSTIYPEHSLELCLKAERMEVNERQQVQNRIARLVAQTRLYPDEVTFDEIMKLQETAKKFGMNNVLGRLANIEACLNLYKNRTKTAIDQLKYADNKATIKDSRFEQWQIEHNIGICYILEGKIEEASRYFARSASKIKEFNNCNNLFKEANIINLAGIKVKEFLKISLSNASFDESYLSQVKRRDIKFFYPIINNIKIILKNISNSASSYKIYQEIHNNFSHQNNLEASLDGLKYIRIPFKNDRLILALY